jgi:hypothetical protein
VQLVCATHPQSDAIARCVRCGLHLCDDCRTLDGVRNFCSRCRSLARAQTVATAAAAAAVAVPADAAGRVEVPAVARRPTPRSPFLAAALSLVPGLGQAYAGRLLRGAAFFGSTLLLREAPFSSPLLLAYVYALNLFDAWRVAQARTDAANGKTTASRGDDVVFLLVGVAVLAVSFMQLGGFIAAPNRTLLPLAAVAAGLVVAHETRR